MNVVSIAIVCLFIAVPGTTAHVSSATSVDHPFGGEMQPVLLEAGFDQLEESAEPWETMESTLGFDLSWFTIDSGGGVSSSGAIVLSGTIGQFDAGMMSGGSFELAGGYWTGGAITPVVPPCVGDINNSGGVDVFDLLLLLESWGSCPAPCSADLNNSGAVDVFDLLLLLENWGVCRD
ncbi:MAG: hypothetical protein EA377_13425 [Phycisphaerales bacterium]|nr:MAG: hypothetical protein EA377_13425 [Phycisphaerales bacterium]